MSNGVSELKNNENSIEKNLLILILQVFYFLSKRIYDCAQYRDINNVKLI